MADNNDGCNQLLQTHQLQFVLNSIPKHLYRCLYEKMKNEIFDSVSYFQICPVDDDDEEFYISSHMNLQ
ncbi:unnamed protein product [Rotaria sordida]|uniref:Uncharacterized protein n=1 Tax=Rotaria sordida TaxID=392033 RepID=A0A819F9M9_9BILA|nr:unnamed protein product [Rotaria sordida]CAF3864945.1 unnamed protein product [Rotaria sordida]